MSHLERWNGTVKRQSVDRCPIFCSCTPEFERDLAAFLGTDIDTALHVVFDVDLRRTGEGLEYKSLEPAYTGPPPRRFEDGSFENVWGVRQRVQHYGLGDYTESVGFPLAYATTRQEVEAHTWPSPDWFDYSSILEPLRQYPDYPFIAGYLAIGWFAWELREMSHFLTDLYAEPVVAEAIIEKVSDFGYGYYRRLIDAARDHIGRNFVCIHLADDWATQTGPVIDPALYKRYFKRHYARIVDMAHAEGLLVEFHCCGSSIRLIPEFIDTGFDILNPLQTSARDMNPPVLKDRFGSEVLFSGGIDVQKLLPAGSVASVTRGVHELLDAFPGSGLIAGPAHNIQPGTPPGNVVAAYRAIYDHFGLRKPDLEAVRVESAPGTGAPLGA